MLWKRNGEKIWIDLTQSDATLERRCNTFTPKVERCLFQRLLGSSPACSSHVFKWLPDLCADFNVYAGLVPLGGIASVGEGNDFKRRIGAEAGWDLHSCSWWMSFLPRLLACLTVVWPYAKCMNDVKWSSNIINILWRSLFLNWHPKTHILHTHARRQGGKPAREREGGCALDIHKYWIFIHTLHMVGAPKVLQKIKPISVIFHLYSNIQWQHWGHHFAAPTPGGMARLGELDAADWETIRPSELGNSFRIGGEKGCLFKGWKGMEIGWQALQLQPFDRIDLIEKMAKI